MKNILLVLLFCLTSCFTHNKFAIYQIYYTNGKIDKIITKHKLSLTSNGCVWDEKASEYIGCYVQKMTVELDN